MSIFSAKHYKWFASYAARNLTVGPAMDLARELEKENPNFDMTKFCVAIMSESKKIAQKEPTP